MVTMRSNPAEFKRLRTRTEAMLFSDGDKAGPLMIVMDQEHIKQVRRAYGTEGATTGQGSWPRLSPRYAAWKRKAYPGRRILVRTRETFQKFVQPTSASHIRRFIQPFTYAFGAASEAQWRHENAAGVGRQVLPRRSILAKTGQDLQGFQRALVGFWTKRVRQALRHL